MNCKIFVKNFKIYIIRKIFKFDYKKINNFLNLNMTPDEFEKKFIYNKEIKMKIAINVYFDDDILAVYMYNKNDKLIKNII